jgi:hypothetical protein
MRPQTLIAILCIATGCYSFVGTSSAAEPMKSAVPLIRAHAHNDYEHQRPLLDALDHGFCSVEADIYLVEGTLLVAHDRDKVRPDRTLQSLYLDPLRARVKANGGRVYPKGPSVMLLIDIKSDAEQTYAVLRTVLKEYADILTEFTADQTTTNAVTVVLSGNRPRQTMANEARRHAAYDGRLSDLESNASPHLIPLVSDNWRLHFKWLGVGPMPDDEKRKLNGIVSQVHRQGCKVRFWATPDRPEIWKELYDSRIDLINTDNLAGLQTFLLTSAGK